MMFLQLTNSGQKAIIDDDDLEYCKPYSWYLENDNHVRTNINGKKKYLHNFILGGFQNHLIDHQDGNPLNNCKSNLKAATYRDNNNNIERPDCKVVQVKGGWQAVIKHKGKIYRSDIYADRKLADAKFEMKMNSSYGLTWRKESKKEEANLL